VRTRVALTVLSLLLVPAAAAQPPGLDLPRGAVPVAGPTSSGARLYVWDQHGDLCGSATRPRARFRGSSCRAGAPRGLRQPLIETDGGGRGPAYVWGFVDPEVAAVELVTARGRHLAAQTTAGARYRGKYAGELRFFLIQTRLPRDDGLFYVRLLDANGGLLAAVNASFPGRSGHIGQTRVARGQTAGARWTLRAFTTRELVPLPGDEERIVTRHCVSTDLSPLVRAPYPQVTAENCDEPDYPQPVDMGVERTCGPVGIQISGMADRGVRLLAVLGDGSRRQVALHSLPGRFGSRRAFALLLEPKVALRELVAIEGGRRAVQISELAPGVFDCPDSSSGYTLGFPLSLPPFGPGPPAFQLRDEGVLLCATLGLPDPERRDCGRPPLDAESSWILTHADDSATAVAGVVSPDVGSVTVLLADGQRQTVPTAPDGAYTGRYRDLIRTFSISIPGRHELRRAVLYGLDGQRLYSTRAYSPPKFEVEPTLLRRTRSGWRLGAGLLAFYGRRSACAQLVRGDFELDPFACTFGDSRVLRVTCSPRSALLYGWMNARVVDIVTTKRRFSRKGISARELGIDRSALLVELGGDEALRSLTFRGRKTQRFRGPSPARQCGYTEDVTR
jgi:hypothetical protein